MRSKSRVSKRGFLQAHVDFLPADQAIKLDRARSPFELDLGRLVDFNKPNFNGRRALLEERRRGSRYRLVRLDIDGNKPAHSSYIYADRDKGEVVGTVTSAEWSPSAKANIALASMHMPWGRPGEELWVDIYYRKELEWSRRHGPRPRRRRRVLRSAAAARNPCADF